MVQEVRRERSLTPQVQGFGLQFSSRGVILQRGYKGSSQLCVLVFSPNTKMSEHVIDSFLVLPSSLKVSWLAPLHIPTSFRLGSVKNHSLFPVCSVRRQKLPLCAPKNNVTAFVGGKSSSICVQISSTLHPPLPPPQKKTNQKQKHPNLSYPSFVSSKAASDINYCWHCRAKFSSLSFIQKSRRLWRYNLICLSL